MDNGMTIRDLRRRWKPRKQELQAERDDHSTNVRVYRACSWLQRAEQLDGEDDDTGLICRWIAFNSLYGRWNAARGEPREDRASWRAFLELVLALDADGRIEEVLIEHKKLVMALLGDEFLARFFWAEPGEDPSH